jgi:hypothetical protein
MGCNEKENNDLYCPDCMGVMVEALESVPVKFKKRWVETTDYTRKDIVSHQEERERLAGHPVLKRMMFGLVDTKTGENEKTVCELMKEPSSRRRFYYRVSWWESTGEEKITKEIWWDLEKDAPAEDQWNGIPEEIGVK